MKVMGKLEALERLEGSMNAQAAVLIGQLVKVQTELSEVKKIVGHFDVEELKAWRASKSIAVIDNSVQDARPALTALVASVEPDYIPVQFISKPFADSRKERLTPLLLEFSHPFQCPICRTRFPHSTQLSHHVTYTHRQGNTAHKCHKCKMSFSNPQALQRHLLVHGTEESKQFKCSQCSYASAFKANLKAHVYVQHGGRSKIDKVAILPSL